jgi:hypothetical protein
MPQLKSPRGVVVRYPKSDRVRASGHESVSLGKIAGRLAALKGYDYSEQYGPHCASYPHVYFIPDNTLTETQAHALSIFNESDLFGGIVPHPFVATKLISHGLFDDGMAPAGWSSELGEQLQGAVLPGYSAFGIRDAHRAGLSLLEHGPVRVKVGWGVGGCGQVSVSNPRALQEVLDKLDPAAVSRGGVVLETDISEKTTYSVGQIQVCDMRISYYGNQASTLNGKGEKVYGGSSLILVRGGFSELLSLKIEPAAVVAIAQAREYDAAVSRAYPGLIASRRNYDVIHGHDASAQQVSGVLEQSWRVGGASPAEIAALDMFLKHPDLNVVRSSCVEAYGEHEPPPQAMVYFCDVDRLVGRITKYCMVENCEDSS